MNFFTRDDGAQIQVVKGFRERALSYRSAVTPREEWSDADYAEAAAKKRKRFQRIADKARAFGFEQKMGRVLDVGRGDASNCLLFAGAGAHVNGIDLQLLLLQDGAKGERTRRFAAHLIGSTTPAVFDVALKKLPLQL